MQRACGLVIALLLSASSVDAQIRLDDNGKLTLYGDLRLRFESDWDSRRPDGSLRDDRDRLRIRARVGLNWKPIDLMTVGLRLRTGSRTAQQSPHLTLYDFEGNDTGPKEVAVDRLFLRFGRAGTEAWFGRNSYPFWRQNELFWDDDASLTGGTVRHEWRRDPSRLELMGGFYLLPDGMEAFAGNLAAGQFAYTYVGREIGVTLASGFFFIYGSDNARYLRNGNGQRDYRFWAANAQARVNQGKIPVVLGLDFMHNFQSYSPTDPDPFTAANHDQKTGFVASVAFGETRDRWDWLVAYYYAYIETFAVNASFAQDDWMRWGSPSQTDASDFKGHEVRFAMNLIRNLNVVARLYLLEAITTVQNGKRFRLDLNYQF